MRWWLGLRNFNIKTTTFEVECCKAHTSLVINCWIDKKLPFLWRFQTTTEKRPKNIQGTRQSEDNLKVSDGHNLLGQQYRKDLKKSSTDDNLKSKEGITFRKAIDYTWKPSNRWFILKQEWKMSNYVSSIHLVLIRFPKYSKLNDHSFKESNLGFKN